MKKKSESVTNERVKCVKWLAEEQKNLGPNGRFKLGDAFRFIHYLKVNAKADLIGGEFHDTEKTDPQCIQHGAKIIPLPTEFKQLFNFSDSERMESLDQDQFDYLTFFFFSKGSYEPRGTLAKFPVASCRNNRFAISWNYLMRIFRLLGINQ